MAARSRSEEDAPAMNIHRTAVAGTLESNDVLVTVAPNGAGGLAVELESIVGKLYGENILAVVNACLAELGVADARVSLKDRGALDCAIRARVETAVRRAGKEAD